MKDRFEPSGVDFKIIQRRREIISLFDEIAEIAHLDQKMYENLNVGVSSSIRFMHKGQHFGVFAFKRLDRDYQTRAVLLDAFSSDDLPIPYYPPISKYLVNLEGDKVVDQDEEEIKDVSVLEQQVNILKFIKDELGDESVEERTLAEVEGAISEVAGEMWNGEDLAFERERDKFFDALILIREKSRKVGGSDYKTRGAVELARTDWATVKMGKEVFDLRYVKYDAYANGDWTDFEAILTKKPGEKTKGRTLFEVSNISRNPVPFGEVIDTAPKVKKYTKLIKDMNRALETKSKENI